MKKQIIVPDLNATEVIDLAQCQLEYGLVIAERLVSVAKPEELEEREASLKEVQEALAEYEPAEDMPKIVIGYLPEPKRSYLLNAGAAEGMDSKGKPLADRMNSGIDLAREWVQWGVKGHRNLAGYPYSTKQASAGGREFKITADDCVDLYEQMDSLRAIEHAVMEFNLLDSKKKTKLKSTSTEETATLTADDVTVTST